MTYVCGAIICYYMPPATIGRIPFATIGYIPFAAIGCKPTENIGIICCCPATIGAYIIIGCPLGPIAIICIGY